MMISDLAVRKRTSVAVLTLVILVFGLIAYLEMPRESDPDITIPYVFVSSRYPGVAPEDIEKSITIPIEKKLKSLEGVKKISSTSMEGSSSIVIEFIAGTDIDEVLPKTKDKVDLARPDLPSDMEDDPEVTEVNFAEMPIIVISLSGPVGLVRLKQIAEDIEEEIESIKGVLEAEVTGGLEREIRVEPSPEKLAYFGIPITNLQNVISGENRNVSGGTIRMGDGRFRLRVPGEFETPDDIYGLVIGLHKGRPVYLKDAARVVDGFKDEAGVSRLNGHSAVNIQVKKRSGENILHIADQIDSLLEKRRPSWPNGVTATKLMDKADDVRMMVSDLENNIITGLILVVAVLFFVMGIRNAILVSLAIPFSMFISFMILHAMGITLNMVVLFSLTLSLGMLVDNAIVIVENIFRYMEQGVPRINAAVKAAAEVAQPVTASTLTTVAAFFPMIFWPGIMGEFMGYLPRTVIVTLSSSLFVALVINPALASIFMRVPFSRRAAARGADAGEVEKAGEAPIEVKGPFLSAYRSFLGAALRNRIPVVILSFLSLVIMFMVWLFAIGVEKPVEFFPDIDPKAIYVNLDMPEGADLDYSDRVARAVEAAVCGPAAEDGAHPCFAGSRGDKIHQTATGVEFSGPSDMDDIKYVYSRAVAVAGGKSAFEGNLPNHIGVQFLDMKDRLKPSSGTVEDIRRRVADIPGAGITVSKQQEGPPTGAPINIEITGEDFNALGRISAEIVDHIEKIPFVRDIRDDYVSGSPTVKLKVDRQKAALVGLSTETVGFIMKVAFNGIKVSTYREGDEDYDITVQLPESRRRQTDFLREFLIPTPSGMIPLSSIATFEVTGGLGKISRINHERVVTVKAEVDEKHIPGPVVRAQAEKMLADFPLPPGYSIRFTGENEAQEESQAFLTKAFAAAIFLIMLILVTQFNSVSQPIIIITSVILSLGGVFFGLAVMRMPFGIIMTGVGVISLAGVVVNNAIVLIDYINRLKERGMPTYEAIIAAGCTRLRPVLLTAATTILGLLPMVTGVAFDFHLMEISWVSESSQWWRSMASAVIFGLTLATVLTLLVVPVLYSLVYTTSRAAGSGVRKVRRAYWAPFYRITGTKPPHEG
ncbi:Acriflavin resistance protein [Candidatus Desulfarcum epimagneticum]|uniref:Acriflavin resistance protein n=1 Tax=uncultured Desulfobacteraceae bacterium TaxID=218296 RepID=A0A484HH58_9BACT|nr:Acriflavin resistance protein [uncultured Desulfobacteraceae bacterium]